MERRVNHWSECDRDSHAEPVDGSDPGPCHTTPQTVGTAAVWLQQSETGPVVRTDIPDTVHTLLEWARLCEVSQVLLARVGVPIPRAGTA